MQPTALISIQNYINLFKQLRLNKFAFMFKKLMLFKFELDKRRKN